MIRQIMTPQWQSGGGRRGYLKLLASVGSFALFAFIASRDSSIRIISNVYRKLLHVDNYDAELPDVAWLIAYPGSGEDYVRQIVQDVSQTTMATNYGFDVFPNPSVGPNHNGPYAYRSDLPLPDNQILSLTHCTGYCLRCSDNLYTGGWRHFYVRCGAGNFLDTGIPNENRYKTESVSKQVHLIRDPFDNIIERFYLDYEANKDSNDGHWKYDLDRAGLKEWCSDFDKSIKGEKGIFLKSHIPEKLANVPCHGLFYQYILWHNNVAEVMGSLGWRISEYVIHYEDFVGNKEKIFDLFQYLELPIKGSIPDVPHRRSLRSFHQADFFLENERTAMSSMMKVIARRDIWTEVSQYLPPPRYEDLYAPVGAELSPETFGKWPDLVWLMTFPKAGTEFTVRAMEKLSKSTTATNYAEDTGDNYEVYPHVAYSDAGPFRRCERPFPETYIVTKTFCDVCPFCDPKHEITSSDFLHSCGRSRTRDNRLKYYDPATVKKIIHIVRSPFDNIVFTFQSRFKRAKQNNDLNFENQYTFSPEGFKTWCHSLDSRFDKANSPFKGTLADVAAKIPCYGILFQYVQWHNNAVETRKQLNATSIVLHFEDYRNNLQKSLPRLFDFVEQSYPPSFRDILIQDEFLADSILKPSPDYYTAAERNAIGYFVNLVASPDAYKILKRYF